MITQIVAYVHVESNELLFHPNITSFSFIRDRMKTLKEMNEGGYRLILIYEYSHRTNPCGYNDKGYDKKLAIFEKVN